MPAADNLHIVEIFEFPLRDAVAALRGVVRAGDLDEAMSRARAALQAIRRAKGE